MAIQVRRGLKKDFIPEKLLPGEWAVSIDSETENQIVWMCFAPGVTKRMGTYEDFRKQIEEISDGLLDDYKTELNVIKSAVETIASDVETDKNAVVTIKSDITDTLIPQIQQFVNQAEGFKDNAKTSADNALESSNMAQGFAQNASDNAELSSDFAVLSESFTHGGTGKREGEDTDNAKYYMEQAKSAVGGDFVSHDEVGKPNGVASLDANGKVPEEQIPMSKVDVDTELSEESENPVQNKVITAEISKLNSDLVELDNNISNPNLIDNPFFSVNDRGQTEYNEPSKYTVNRWKLMRGVITVLPNNGIKLSSQNDQTSLLNQFTRNWSEYIGKTYTMSAIINGIVYSHTFNNITESNLSFRFNDTDDYIVFGLNFDVAWKQDYRPIQIFGAPRTELEIKMVMLEEGNKSTIEQYYKNYISASDTIETINCRNSTADPTDEYANGYNPLISDAWVPRTWTAGEICISDNNLWKCLVDNSEKPSEGANWHQTNIASELKNIYALLSKNNIK